MFALPNGQITTSASSSLIAERPLQSNRSTIKGAPPQHEAPGWGNGEHELGCLICFNVNGLVRVSHAGGNAPSWPCLSCNQSGSDSSVEGNIPRSSPAIAERLDRVARSNEKHVADTGLYVTVGGVAYAVLAG
jgi:hypothetical protein